MKCLVLFCVVRREAGGAWWSVTIAVKEGCETSPTSTSPTLSTLCCQCTLSWKVSATTSVAEMPHCLEAACREEASSMCCGWLCAGCSSNVCQMWSLREGGVNQPLSDCDLGRRWLSVWCKHFWPCAILGFPENRETAHRVSGPGSSWRRALVSPCFAAGYINCQFYPNFYPDL